MGSALSQTLTPALSQRERGLIALDSQNMPTLDTESYLELEKPTDRLPLPPGEGWAGGVLMRVRLSAEPKPPPQTRDEKNGDPQAAVFFSITWPR